MCGFAGLILGGAAGLLTASLVDASFLAYVEKPARPLAGELPLPTLAITAQGGVMLGLAGRL